MPLSRRKGKKKGAKKYGENGEQTGGGPRTTAEALCAEGVHHPPGEEVKMARSSRQEIIFGYLEIHK